MQAAVFNAVQSLAFGCRKTRIAQTAQHFGHDEGSVHVELAATGAARWDKIITALCRTQLGFIDGPSLRDP